ncbi:MAG: ABC transporter permease [Hyphomicrobiaceae bacterium]|nr:ABC transporter permease [Hyphomicrobiaceae bacterium]
MTVVVNPSSLTASTPQSGPSPEAKDVPIHGTAVSLFAVSNLVDPPSSSAVNTVEPIAENVSVRPSKKIPSPGQKWRAAIGDFISGPGFIITWTRRALALVLGVLWWQWAVEVELNLIVNFEHVASPVEVWNSLIKQLEGNKFLVHILVSIKRVAIAYALAAVIGIVLGLAMGRSRIAYDFVIPYVEILRPIPAVTWIPLAILMWPTEESSIIFITFLGAVFPIILNTVAGVEQTPEVLVRAARSLGARKLQIFRHVVLPAALPNIATGLSVGMGVAWFSLLAGEIISGQYGIGYFTWTSYQLIKYPEIIVGMLTIGLLGTLSTLAVQLATAPFLRWRRVQR